MARACQEVSPTSRRPPLPKFSYEFLGQTVLMLGQFRRDRNSAIESIAFAISGILTLGTGALVGGAYLLGLISGAAAISTVSTIGAVLAVVAAIVVIWAVIQAAKERRVRLLLSLF